MLPPTDFILRRLLWVRHGCPFAALYKDDGEMQCVACGIDFSRDSAEAIEARFIKLGFERLKKEGLVLAP